MDNVKQMDVWPEANRVKKGQKMRSVAIICNVARKSANQPMVYVRNKTNHVKGLVAKKKNVVKG